MPSSDRVRRRDQPTGRAPEPPAPAVAPDVASLLAIQRSAGNRALQRLIFNDKNHQLGVPDTYGQRPVMYNGVQQPLVQHANDPLSDFSQHLQTGLRVDQLSQVGSVPDVTFGNQGAALSSEAKPGEVAAALRNVAVDVDRLLVHTPKKKYAKTNELDIKWVMSNPEDFIPGANDLPGANADLKTTRIPNEEGYYWEYACVLIALVQLDPGMTKTQLLLGQQPASQDAAVQALHTYYVNKKVYYDDTSTRVKLMGDWGYTPVFAGDCAFEDLAQHVTLTPQGKYIFDIDGHTVNMTVDRTLPTGKKMPKPSSFMTPHSHPENWDDKETFKQSVKYVWKKG